MGLGAEFTGAGRSVIGTGFALPRVPTGGRRSRACGAAPPCWGPGATAFSQQEVVWHSRRQGVASSAMVSRSRAMPTGGRRSLACAPLCPVGARRNCIFTVRGGVALTAAGRRVISNGFARPRDADRRSAFPCLRRRSALLGARRNCIFTARGGVALTAAGRRVISNGFALPRDADRRSAFPGLRAALPGRGSARLHFHSKRWCGTHGGRAQRHRRGFRAPARADRRSAFPGLRAALPGGGSAQLHFHSKRWCATYGGRAQRHERWFRAPARCRSETGAPSRPRARSRSAVRGFAALWAAVPV